ncbi:MAG TPA: hypothetical protein VGG06_12710 [Thermoanaerobaculia bacterium]|jgi:hypothetical protein
MRLKAFSALPLVLVLVILLPATAGAELCDDIDAVADGWAAVADALEETAGEDVGDLDLPRLERDVNILLDPTEKLGNALVEFGNADEEALGNDLLDMVDEIHDIDGDDLAAYLVDRIDDLVDTLDDVVAYCDEVNE